LDHYSRDPIQNDQVGAKSKIKKYPERRGAAFPFNGQEQGNTKDKCQKSDLRFGKRRAIRQAGGQPKT